MQHLGTRRLETTRLLLRQFSVSDAEAMYTNWAHDPQVTKHLTWPCHETMADSKAILEDWTKQYGKNNFYQWAIVLKEESNNPIGSIAVVYEDTRVEKVEMGYCIGQAWWGQGITAEALAALVTFFFEEVGVNRIEARHDPHNPNSGKVMLKCGLQYEGTHRDSGWSNQGRCDYSMYAILAKDYPDLKKNR